MCFGFNLIHDPHKPALLIDDKGSSDNTHEFAAHEFLQAPHAILVCERVVLIDKRVKLSPSFSSNFFKRVTGSGLTPNADRFKLLKLLQRIPQTAGLSGAAERHGLGIEIQHNVLFPPEVLQGNVVTVLIF